MYPVYDSLTIDGLTYIQRDNQLTRELYRRWKNKGEETMTKYKKYFKGQTLIRNDGNEVEFLHDDGGEFIPILTSHGDNTDWIAREDVKPSNKFTFAQVIQGLLEDYFEKGTEFRANGRSVFVDFGWKGYLGLVDDLGGGFLRMEIGANLIHATWELTPKEEPIKELTLNELEEILGHKVKIKNND